MAASAAALSRIFGVEQVVAIFEQGVQNNMRHVTNKELRQCIGSHVAVQGSCVAAGHSGRNSNRCESLDTQT
jgi:hypothetical protein